MLLFIISCANISLTFLAVHSNTFIGLVQRRWNLSSTWLWCYPVVKAEEEADQENIYSGGIAEDRGRREPIELSSRTNNTNRETAQDMTAHVLAWYIFGMPLWCSLAKLGQKKLNEHFQKEEMISPGIVRPKRIMVVKPSHPHHISKEGGLIRSPSDSAISSSEQISLLHPKSQSVEHSQMSNTLYGSTQVVAGNKGIARAIASRNSQASSFMLERTNSLSSLEVEQEFRNDDPTWVDFRIAIGYIALGIVAMTFGLASILM